jgi:hypothetical protein
MPLNLTEPLSPTNFSTRLALGNEIEHARNQFFAIFTFEIKGMIDPSLIESSSVLANSH